jgi:nitrilase
MTRVAVVQAASIPFDSAATVAKAEGLIAECAAGGAELAVFPEAFVGCYPKGSAFGAVVGRRSGPGRDLYRRYFEAAVELDGREVGRLLDASAAHGVFVVVGVIERLGATLYCTVLMIDPVAGLLGIHRKLMPTGTERLIWGFGDGSTIGTAQSPAGRVGVAICWENYMPALRQAMYAQGVELYCAPTADDRPTWMSTMTHVALEGRVFVLSACQAIRASAYPDSYQREIGADPDSHLMRGGSAILAPDGAVLAGPVFEEETVLYADVELGEIARGHLDMDAVGHYSRPDIFELRVDTSPRSPVVFSDSDSAPSPTARNRRRRAAPTRTAVAIRHVEFEDLGLLEALLAEHGFATSYLDAPAGGAWDSARDADLLVVLGGPLGVADTDAYPFLRTELELVGERLARDRPTLGICLGAQLLAVACGGSVRPGIEAEVGYAPLTLTSAARDSVLEPLRGVPVLHWHGDVISTPPELPALASTPLCENQAFARSPNVLALQFHLEADSASLERWLVGHTYELAARGIGVAGLREDACTYAEQLASRGHEVFDAWLSGLIFSDQRPRIAARRPVTSTSA